MKALLALIKKLYGSKAIQKAIGTRTNVITLPNKDTKRFLTNELNIDAASDKAVQKAYEDAEKLIPELAKLNDQEILTFTGNLRRLDQRLNPPSAPIIDIKTKKPVTGIEKLAAERGIPSDVDPDSPLGKLMMDAQKLKAQAKELEEMTSPFKMFEEMVTSNPYRPGGPLDPAVGITRAGARLILEKKGIKIGSKDPLDLVRENFGQDVLNDINNVSEELLEIDRRGGTYKDLSDVLEREGLFDVKINKDAPKGYSDKEFKKLLKEAEDKDLGDKLKNLPNDIDPDAMAKGGRVGYAYGSGLRLLNILRKKGKSLKQAVREAVDDLNLSGDKKLDADMAVDNMLENLNIDRDAVDGYDILDAYDEAYKQISNPQSEIFNLQNIQSQKDQGLRMLGMDPADFPDLPEEAISIVPPKSEVDTLKSLGATKTAERLERAMLKEKYPGITDELVNKILIDDNPQRKAEVLATLDEAMTMGKRGMSDEEILKTIKKTTRTKQANGGIAYLMGL